MTTKHTPGPWRITQDTYHVGIMSDSGVIAATRLDDKQHWSTQDNALANARLIAAAPEMLEALKTLIDGGMVNISVNDWNAARSAIAKAEGVDK